LGGGGGSAGAVILWSSNDVSADDYKSLFNATKHDKMIQMHHFSERKNSEPFTQIV